MAETFGRISRGEPALYYSWHPSWFTNKFQPGKDVVWLEIPFDALPAGMEASIQDNPSLIKDVVGCAGDHNPCHMAQGPWNYRTVVNKEFAEGHPDIIALLEQVRFSSQQWAAWEGAISDGAKRPADLKRLADEWIAGNQASFDAWVKNARNAD